jgi:hypothetical protein
MKPTPANLQKLEDLFKALHYTVRYEKGNFQSGYCIVESRNMVVVNKFFDTAGRFGTLVDILIGLKVEPEGLPDKNRDFYLQISRQVTAPLDEA